MALLNFKYGVQSALKETFNAGTVYITSDTKKLFIDNPHGNSGRVCLSDFQLINWTKNETVTAPTTALNNHSLKNADTLYITVETATGATAMWRYDATSKSFKSISNSEEIADIVSDIGALGTRTSELEKQVLHYGTCSTAAGTAAKTVTCSNFKLYTGALIAVKMTNANSVANATLNVNSTGAKSIYANGAALTATDADNWTAGSTVLFAYNGSQWEIVDSAALTKAESARSLAAAAMPKTGGTFTGNVSMGSGKTLTVNAPTEDSHAATKKYVDDEVSDINTNMKEIEDSLADYMPIAGGQFTGDVSFADGEYLTVNTPSADGHAATKKYVDEAKAALLGSSSAATTSNATIYDVKRAAAAAQDRADDAYDLATEAKTAAEDADKKFADYLPKANPALSSGSLTLVDEPTAAKHATTKTYVDGAASGAETRAKAHADSIKTALLGQENYTGTIKGAYEAAATAKTAADAAKGVADAAMPKTGGEFSGVIKIPAPVDGADATNKTYVDEALEDLKETLEGNATSDTKDSVTIIGAKKYTDSQITTVNTTISTLQNNIGNLSNIMNFLGTTTTALTNGGTTNPIKIDNKDVSAVKGDVVVNGNKEFVFDGSKWAEIGDVSAQAQAITNLQNSVGTKPTAEGTPAMDDKLWDEVTDLRTDLGETGDPATKTTTAFGRIKALEEWEGTHSTQYTNLKNTVDDHENRLDTLEGWKTSHGNEYTALEGRVDVLEAWKTSHAGEYNALEGRVDALEAWKNTHSTEFDDLSDAVSDNSDAIDNLIAVLTWGTF